MLKVGDIIHLQVGQKVYADIPMKFVYQNRKASTEITHHEVVIGNQYSSDDDLTQAIEHVAKGVFEAFESEGFPMTQDAAMDLVRSAAPKISKTFFWIDPGTFVVIRTALDGGGTGMGPHDIYPDGHHVFCKRAPLGKWDANGIEVDFYQSGCFTAMIENIKPMGFMKISLVGES